MARREFGNIRKLPSGRFQARYTVGSSGVWVNAPRTFTNKTDARDWLARQRTKLEDEAAGAPKSKIQGRLTFADQAERWLKRPRRNGPLRPSTLRTYRHYLDNHLLPTFGDRKISTITQDDVEDWYAVTLTDRPTLRAHVYSLLKSVLGSAGVQISIEGASSTTPKSEPTIATPKQIEALAAAMPDRLALTVLLGAWCQMRQGEVLELRQKDLDVKAGVIHVRRGVTWTDGEPTVGPPKTRAGVRDIHIPPHVLPAIKAHLKGHANHGKNGLLFPARPGEDRQMHPSTFSSWYFGEARRKVGLKGIRFHHLRHTGLTMAAQAGATLAELQARAGHSTPHMAMRYQSAVAERDRALAERLSEAAQHGGS